MRKTPQTSLSCLLFTLLMGSTAVARAELIEIEWVVPGRFERNTVVPPGKFAEVCGKLAQGDAVAWSFKSDAPMNFNIHFHVGEDVTYPTKQSAVMAAEGQLKVDALQDYCWMWSNKGSKPATLQLTLRR